MGVSGTNEATQSVPFGTDVAATGDANSNGSSGAPARSDHVHKGVVANEAWTTWSPSWTNFTPDTSTVVAKYTKIGRTVHWRMTVTLAGSFSVGDVRFSLPDTAAGDYAGSSTLGCIGFGTLLGTATYQADIRLLSTTIARLLHWNSSAQSAVISSTVPFTWSAGHSWDIGGTYEAAA